MRTTFGSSAREPRRSQATAKTAASTETMGIMVSGRAVPTAASTLPTAPSPRLRRPPRISTALVKIAAATTIASNASPNSRSTGNGNLFRTESSRSIGDDQEIAGEPDPLRWSSYSPLLQRPALSCRDFARRLPASTGNAHRREVIASEIISPTCRRRAIPTRMAGGTTGPRHLYNKRNCSIVSSLSGSKRWILLASTARRRFRCRSFPPHSAGGLPVLSGVRSGCTSRFPCFL
jgi:hypothetical protein